MFTFSVVGFASVAGVVPVCHSPHLEHGNPESHTVRQLFCGGEEGGNEASRRLMYYLGSVLGLSWGEIGGKTFFFPRRKIHRRKKRETWDVADLRGCGVARTYFVFIPCFFVLRFVNYVHLM